MFPCLSLKFYLFGPPEVVLVHQFQLVVVITLYNCSTLGIYSVFFCCSEDTITVFGSGVTLVLLCSLCGFIIRKMFYRRVSRSFHSSSVFGSFLTPLQCLVSSDSLVLHPRILSLSCNYPFLPLQTHFKYQIYFNSDNRLS